jgi:hypothetical protein
MVAAKLLQLLALLALLALPASMGSQVFEQVALYLSLEFWASKFDRRPRCAQN